MKRRNTYRLPRPVERTKRDIAKDMRYVFVWTGLATALLCAVVLIAT